MSRSQSGRRLAELVERGDGRIATGFLGTPLVLPALTRAGQVGAAYRLLLNEAAPGWLYQVAHGATTLWERWDAIQPDGAIHTGAMAAEDAGSMISFNHYAYGAVGAWLYRSLAGIAPDADQPGYRMIRFQPQPGGGLTWAEGSIDTPFGRAAIRWDAVWNRLTLDGLMRGTVPEVLVPALGKVVQPGDLDLVKAPIDLIGMNYYSRFTVRREPGRLFDVGWGRSQADRFTAYGWPVEPQGLKEMLLQLKTLYGNPAVLITENGAAYADDPSAGVVEDDERITFLRDHLLALQEALDEGCNVKGYMAWSLLDNFEWQMGYKMRFGLVFVDFADDRKRIPKASYDWFRRVAGTGIPA